MRATPHPTRRPRDATPHTTVSHMRRAGTRYRGTTLRTRRVRRCPGQLIPRSTTAAGPKSGGDEQRTVHQNDDVAEEPRTICRSSAVHNGHSWPTAIDW